MITTKLGSKSVRGVGGRGRGRRRRRRRERERERERERILAMPALAPPLRPITLLEAELPLVVPLLGGGARCII